ncbi:MAG: NFACT RNA binding domain-containing protein [Candidatus Anstonellaceae archaeon]
MKLRLDYRKTASENARDYFDASKEAASKEKGLEEAIRQTEKEIEEAKLKMVEQTKEPQIRRKKEWYEKYRWFFTSAGKLVVAGRDAKQNDMLVMKIMAGNDLFFHADIQGAAATILIGGKDALLHEKNEAAQFAAAHSSAWKIGASAVDVYAVGKNQLSKHAQGGFVGQGGFAIEGKREWFRGMNLQLAIGKNEGRVTCVPSISHASKNLPFLLSPGEMEKGEVARIIAKSIGADLEEVILALPSGKFSLIRR